MLNRRYIRIKVFQALYAFSQNENAQAEPFRKQLAHSLTKLQQAYIKTLNLPLALKQYAELELDKHMQRNFKDQNKIDSFQVLINSKVISKFENDTIFSKNVNTFQASWQLEWDKIHTLFEEVENLNAFKKLIGVKQMSDQDEIDLFMAIHRNLFHKSQVFQSIMEDLYIGWIEDQPVLLKHIEKTIELIFKSDDIQLYHVQNDDWNEIEKFGKNLLESVLTHFDSFNEIIENKTKNWDSERIALSDYILMKMALCEFLYFESIPVKVTINEYLELSKVYSTPKSNSFLNGILDNIQKDLKAEGKLVKTGRGLIG